MTVVVGLIGYGLAGSAFHAPVIAGVTELRLAAIATSRADAVRAAWPDVRVTSPDGLIDDPAIDLVVIATPNDSHVPLARAALERGKHVVIDKPFVTEPADGEALIALAAERGRVLTVFHNRRWDDDFQTVRAAIAEGRLGDVRLFEARWDRFRAQIKQGWREEPGEGAGLLADLGPHLIDQALVLFGIPEAVSADIAIQRSEARVDDYFEVTLHYGAMRAILSASTLIAAPRPRFAVHGTGGSLISEGLDQQEPSLRAGHRPGAPGFAARSDHPFATLIVPEGPAQQPAYLAGDYRAFYRGVAAAVKEGAAPPVDPADALTAMRIIAMARESAASGCRIAFAR